MAAEIPNKNFPATAHTTTDEIVKAFRELCLDPEQLDKAAEYMYDTLLDDAVVGVFLEIHQLMKSGTLDALDGVPENDTEVSYRMVDAPNYDIFGVSTAKKPQDCVCPNCERPVAASRFAPHLEKCMGMGRISSRIASRRLATKEVASSSSGVSSLYQQSSSVPSDDDGEDVEWTAEKRRKKTSQNSRAGGSKKSSK